MVKILNVTHLVLCKVKRNLARALSIMTLIFHCSFKFLFQSSSKFLCETKCMVWNVIQSMSARIHCNRDFPSVSRLIAKDCVKIYTKTRTKYPPYNLFLYIDQFRQVLYKYKVLSCLSCQPETYTSKRFQWESFWTPGNPAVLLTLTTAIRIISPVLLLLLYLEKRPRVVRLL